MPILVRKINRAKWNQKDYKKTNDVSGEAITRCLITFNNALSVWEIPTEEKIEEAILALTTCQDHIETLNVVYFNKNDLSGIDIKEIPGGTPVQSLVDSHRDLSDLTYSKIGIVKNQIVDSLRKGKLKRYNEKKIIEILKKAIDEKRVDINKLKPDVKKKLS